jgi:hypothetical protein
MDQAEHLEIAALMDAILDTADPFDMLVKTTIGGNTAFWNIQTLQKAREHHKALAR